MPALGDRTARLADPARIDRRPALPIRPDAVQRLGDQPRGAGLAHPAYAGQQEGMRQPPALDRIAQRRDHRVLADQLAERLRPVFAGEHAIFVRLLGLRGFVEAKGIVHGGNVGWQPLHVTPDLIRGPASFQFASRAAAKPRRRSSLREPGRACMSRGDQNRRVHAARWEPERPAAKSLWLLPSGSDQVGDDHVRPTPGAAYRRSGHRRNEIAPRHVGPAGHSDARTDGAALPRRPPDYRYRIRRHTRSR